MRHVVRVMLCAIVAFGGTAPVAAQSPGAHVTSPCALPAGWDEVAARKPRYVVFGEIHGTQEAPALVGTIACGLASRGERILVAVEHASDENAAFQKAWALSPSEFPAALKQAGWAERDDGVGSEAMLKLLIRLHTLAKAGRPVDIVAFNGARDAEQERRFADLGVGGHEAAQAENIRVAADAKRYDRVLVLVGNVHARKNPVTDFGETYEPMVMRLAPPGSMVTLNMESAGGTSWNCQLKPGFKPERGKPITSEAIACGSYPSNGRTDLHRTPFLSLTPVQGIAPDPAYDGIFWVGKTSASPQAVKE